MRISAVAMITPASPRRRAVGRGRAGLTASVLLLLAAGCGSAHPAHPRAAAPSPTPTLVADPRPAAVQAAPQPVSALAFGAPNATPAQDPAIEDALGTLEIAPSAAPAADGSGWANEPAAGGWGAAAAPTPAAAAIAVRPGPRYWGVATYYGADFQGQPMAAGPVFDMRDPTVTASNSWPLGTRLRVTRIPGSPWDSLLTPAERQVYFGRSIVVTVMDRGAFTHALDLSWGAFAELGDPAEGVIHVLIEPVDGVPPVKGLRGAPAGPDL